MQTTALGIVATRWAVLPYRGSDSVTIELTSRPGEDPERWAVRWRDQCLNADGRWETELQPSSRDEDFLARTRWSRDEAFSRAQTVAADPRSVPFAETQSDRSDDDQ